MLYRAMKYGPLPSFCSQTSNVHQCFKDGKDDKGSNSMLTRPSKNLGWLCRSTRQSSFTIFTGPRTAEKFERSGPSHHIHRAAHALQVNLARTGASSLTCSRAFPNPAVYRCPVCVPSLDNLNEEKNPINSIPDNQVPIRCRHIPIKPPQVVDLIAVASDKFTAAASFSPPSLAGLPLEEVSASFNTKLKRKYSTRTFFRVKSGKVARRTRIPSIFRTTRSSTWRS